MNHELTGVSGQAMAAIIDRAVRAVTSSRDVTYTIFALDYNSVQPMTIFYMYGLWYNVQGKRNLYTQLIAAKRQHQLYKEDNSPLLERILKLFSFQI